MKSANVRFVYSLSELDEFCAPSVRLSQSKVDCKNKTLRIEHAHSGSKRINEIIHSIGECV